MDAAQDTTQQELHGQQEDVVATELHGLQTDAAAAVNANNYQPFNIDKMITKCLWKEALFGFAKYTIFTQLPFTPYKLPFTPKENIWSKK